MDVIDVEVIDVKVIDVKIYIFILHLCPVYIGELPYKDIYRKIFEATNYMRQQQFRYICVLKSCCLVWFVSCKHYWPIFKLKMEAISPVPTLSAEDKDISCGIGEIMLSKPAALVQNGIYGMISIRSRRRGNIP